MSKINHPHHSEAIEYKGFTIVIEVGYSAKRSDERIVAEALIYPNGVSAGLEMKHISSSTEGSVGDKTRDVTERAMLYIDSWVLQADDIRTAMQTAIQSVTAVPAIEEIE
jgi:hypothetical protein